MKTIHLYNLLKSEYFSKLLYVVITRENVQFHFLKECVSLKSILCLNLPYYLILIISKWTRII